MFYYTLAVEHTTLNTTVNLVKAIAYGTLAIVGIIAIIVKMTRKGREREDSQRQEMQQQDFAQPPESQSPGRRPDSE